MMAIFPTKGRTFASLMTAAALAAPAIPAMASAIVVPAPMTPTIDTFPSVGKVGDKDGFFCTGTVMNGNHILTARHCVTTDRKAGGPLRPAAQLRFMLGTVTFSGTVLTAPNNADVAVFKINGSFNVPTLPLYTMTNEVSMDFVGVGYGLGSSNPGKPDSTWDLPFGTKRLWFNHFDMVVPGILGEHTLQFDLDDPTTLNMMGGAISGEGITAPGDSGSPYLKLVDMKYFIAGVHSYGPDAPTIGTTAGGVRVSSFLAWIANAVPEPAAIALMVPAMLAMALFAGPRRRDL